MRYKIMHLPYIIGLAVALVVLPAGRKVKQKIKQKVEHKREMKRQQKDE